MTSEIITVLIITATVLTFYGMWKVFEKAGESRWKAVIPVYNLYVLAKVSGNSGWWFTTFFLFLSPSVPYWIKPSEFETQDVGLGDSIFDLRSLLFHDGLGNEIWLELSFIISTVLLVLFWSSVVKITYDLAYSFGKGAFFSVGLIFLPFIFFPILGLGRARYRDSAKHEVDRSDWSISKDPATIERYIFLVGLIAWLSLNSTGIFGEILVSASSLDVAEITMVSAICALSVLTVYFFRIKDLVNSSQE